MEQFYIILRWYSWNISVIVNVGSWPAIGLSIIKYLAKQVTIRLISQLTNVISILLKCFNGALILKFFIPVSLILLSYLLSKSPVTLNLNKALLLLAAGKSAIAPL